MACMPPLIGKIIRERRIEHKLTQEQLAEQTGKSYRQIIAIENDHTNPKFDTLYALVKELAIPPSQLFGCETPDTEVERFLEDLMSCNKDERKIIIDTARTLIQNLKRAKSK